MNNEIFNQLKFNTGWKTKLNITLFSKEYNVTLKLKAYSEKDGITEKQKSTYLEFDKNKNDLLKNIESMLSNYSKEAATRFIPKVLLIDREGNCGLLCDDINDPDGGIVASIFPKKYIASQDDYL